MATQTQSVEAVAAISGSDKIIKHVTDDLKEEEDEKSVVSMDETLQKKSDPPLKVTFNFVGIRPTKSHGQNKQTSIKLVGVPSTEIKFENLTLNDNVSKLKECISEQFEIPKERSLLIMYGNTKLVKDEELLKNYGITNNSYFLVAIYDNIDTGHNDVYVANDEEDETSRIEREEQRRERDMSSVKRRLKRIQDLKNGVKVEPSNKRKQQRQNNLLEAIQLKDALEKLKIESTRGLDIITQETCTNCMKLPICGHVFTQNSLYHYILSQFKDREQTLKCPHTKCDDNNSLCGQRWRYPIIKQYLLYQNEIKENAENDIEEETKSILSEMSTTEMDELKLTLDADTEKQEILMAKDDNANDDDDDVMVSINAMSPKTLETMENVLHEHDEIDDLAKKEMTEKKEKEQENENAEHFKYGELELLAARNVIEINYDLQRCIECKTLLYRNPGDNNFNVETQCPLCVSNTKFCWGCNAKWSDDHSCDTSFRAQTMQILSKCPLKKVGRVQKVPSVRACPNCHQLINHVSACKHMKCSFCKTSFCFICLKEQQNGQWKCGGYSDACPVHKRQNNQLLPKLNQTSFQLF